jgi:hypothetical protein
VPRPVAWGLEWAMTHSQFQPPAGLRVPGELRADQEAQQVPEMRAKAESDTFPRSRLLRVP